MKNNFKKIFREAQITAFIFTMAIFMILFVS